MVAFFDNPTYICNLRNEQYDSASSDYIISYDELRAMLNDVCNELRHPVTVININYNSNHYIDSRVDSDASNYALRPTCRNFRIAAGDTYCKKCDEYYARYCKGLIENKEYFAEPLDFFADICKKNAPQLQCKNDVEYLIYNCPILGYCEMCYPIYFKKQIIGILIVGEILLDENNTLKQKIADNFFETQYKHEDNNSIFKDYIQYLHDCGESEFNIEYMKYDPLPSYTLYKDYRDNKTLELTDFKKSLNKKEFELLINKCCEKTKIIEIALEKKWEKRKKYYFKTTIEKITKEFNQKYSHIRSTNQIGYENIQNMFNAVCETFYELKNIFKFDYCRIYANLSNITRSYFTKTIGSFPSEYENLNCDFNKTPLVMSQCINSMDAPPELNPLRCFSSQSNIVLNKSENIVLACENLIAIIGVKEVYSKIQFGFEHLKLLFSETNELFLRMSADLDRISTIFIQQQHEKTLHMYRHECAHLAQRIQQNNTYYSNRDRYEWLSAEKRENIFRDINSTAILLQHLSTNIGLLLGSVNSDILQTGNTQLDIRDEINKWRAMFRLELKKKKLRIYNTTAPIDYNITFNIHEELLGIMLLNLIDNAVKYAHWGTNICIEVLPDQIIVKNYGIYIEQGNRPYDLYYRDKENVQKNLGDGIGLYSSKRIAELLNLELFHTCEKVSDFNLALVVEQINRGKIYDTSFINFNEAVKQLPQVRLEEILTPNDYYPPYEQNYYYLPDNTLSRDISKATYCVKFFIKGLRKTSR